MVVDISNPESGLVKTAVAVDEINLFLNVVMLGYKFSY